MNSAPRSLTCRTSFQMYTNDRKIEIRGPGITFRNQGTNSVTINETLILAAGEEFALPEMPQALEDNTQEFSLQFGESGTNSLVIIERTYS